MRFPNGGKRHPHQLQQPPFTFISHRAKPLRAVRGFALALAGAELPCPAEVVLCGGDGSCCGEGGSGRLLPGERPGAGAPKTGGGGSEWSRRS